MVSTNVIERSRLETQKNLDAKRLIETRRKLGQFATPIALATEMVQYAFKVMNQDEICFLDPAFGTGAFYSALLSVFPRDRIIRAVGFEIDETYWRAAVALWNHETPLDLKLADFTRVLSPEAENVRFNLIICNPPYVRHHAMSAVEKRRLVDLAKEATGFRVSGYSGLYCYFLMLSQKWMSKNGIAGWLIPSEFMDVNYGRQVKEFLLRKVTLLRIHRFDPSEVQFDDALVSSAIVWLKNAVPPTGHIVEFSYGGTLLKPAVSNCIASETLKSLPKWSAFPLGSYEQTSDSSTQLENFFTIKRGIATGANEFFMLAREKAEELKIPTHFLKPVLPPPRYLCVSKIEADRKGNPIVDQELVILSCDLSEETVKKDYPYLWHYLLHGKEQGINERYICRHRSPWYSQENRHPAPFLFNIMGRPENSKRKPYRFILNRSKAIATNVYLMLYPKDPLNDLLNRNLVLQEEIWNVLNEIPLADLLKEGRVYGGGLYKIEPRELGHVSAIRLKELIEKRR